MRVRSMRSSLPWSLALLLSLLALASRVTLADEQLVVLSPKLFPDTNGVVRDIKPSLFGLPNYRERLSGTVVGIWGDNRFGCNPLPPLGGDEDDSGESGEGGGGGGMGQTLIVMVERGGGCSFVQKARNAQNAGAAAFLVANDDAAYGTILPFMGGGSDADAITIPGMLVLGSAAAQIRSHLNDTGGVTVSLAYFLPSPDDRVEWDLYTTARDQLPATFIEQFREVRQALGAHSLFEPHYQVLNRGYMFTCELPQASCTEAALATRCGNRCWNCGRYCQNDPDDRLDAGASGQDVVKEQLRRKCLWQYGNDTASDTNTLWWDYMQQHDGWCIRAGAPHMYDESCSLSLIKSLGVPLESITACVGELGYTSSARVETLERELQWAALYTPLPPTPELLVNNQLYKGGLSCPSPISSDCPVFQMICAGFADGTAPAACATSPGCPLGQQRDLCGECGGFNASCTGCDGVAKSGKVLDACAQCLLPDDAAFITDSDKCPAPPKSGGGGGFPVGGVIAIVLGSLALVGGLVYWYMRRQSHRMKDDIDALLRQYLPMDGPVVLGEERRRTIDQTRLIGGDEEDREGRPTL